MTRPQNSILTRGKRVSGVLTKFVIDVNAIIKLKNLQTSLNAHIVLADKYKDDQIRGLKGYATKKNNFKKEGTKQAVIFAGIIHEFAVDTGDNVLAGEMKLVKTSFEGKGELALSLMKNILIIATANKIALADYGITDPQIAAYKANVDGFEEELNGPDAAIGHKHFDTTELDKEIIAIDENLASIEKIMANQADAKPEFFSEFTSANNDGILGGHKKRDPKIPVGSIIIELKDINTKNMIVGGIALVEGEEEVHVTTLSGTPSFEAVQGAQKIIATAIYYKLASKEIIVTGEEQIIEIFMEPLV